MFSTKSFRREPQIKKAKYQRVMQFTVMRKISMPRSLTENKEHGAEDSWSTFFQSNIMEITKMVQSLIVRGTPRHTILGSISDLLRSWIRFQHEYTVGHFAIIYQKSQKGPRLLNKETTETWVKLWLCTCMNLFERCILLNLYMCNAESHGNMSHI